MLSVGFLDSCHQFVELFSAARDVPHECLLDVGIEVTIGEHEIHPFVLQDRCEDFPYARCQGNWPEFYLAPVGLSLLPL